MQDYIIANGQTLADITFAYGDTILVQDGGTLSNSVVPRIITSFTLEDDVILNGRIKFAKEFTVSSSVDASEASLILDISERKPEDNHDQ